MKASTIHRRSAYARSTSYSHHSQYRGARQPSRFQSKTKNNRHGHAMVGVVLTLVVGIGVVVGFKSGSSITPSKQPVITPNSSQAAAAPAPATNHCADNTLDKFIKISISQRHLWACEGSKVAFESPVITGMEKHDETRTPVGTYKVYGKVTDTRLTGKDSTGSWDRPVSYWMPFLHNEHGVYGFHDATWRPDSEFGTIDPNSEQGSHGCVELPIGVSQQLYNWTPLHTTLSVES